MVPNQLLNQRLIKVDNDKRPFEKDWQLFANYTIQDPTFNQWLNQNKRYGVLCGINNLVVIDFDNKEVQDEVLLLGELPETFTVRTARKKLYHLYYYVDNPESWKCLNKDKETLLDIQGRGKQVIGPGTIVPGIGVYDLVNNLPIANISMDKLHKIFDKYNYETIKQKLSLTQTNLSKDNSIEEIKSKYRISDLLSDKGINTSKNPTQCPLHSSKGGKCFSFDDSKGVWHCFHCEEKGDVIHLYQKVNSTDFVSSKKELCQKLGIKDDYNVNRIKALQSKVQNQIKKRFDMVEVIRDFINENPVFYDNNGLWWLWDNNKYIWFKVDETDLLVILFDGEYEVPYLNSVNTQREFISNLKIISRSKKPITPPVSWVQFGNKIYDINSGEEFLATSKYFFTNSLPYNPSEDSTTPIMDKLFIEWVGIENVDLLYEIIAYCCYRDYPIHHLFCFIGSGSNGKSTYLQIINNFIGLDNCTSVSLDSLMNSRFEVSCLYKKLVCLMGETNFSTLSRTEILKKLTGQDLINFEFKNKNPFSDVNYAKILISTNTLPETTDKTDGFYRRWVTVDFPNRFNGNINVLKYIPEYEYNNLARKVIRILPRLIENRCFKGVGSVDERRKQYEEKSNPLQKFIDLYLESNVDGSIFKFDFCERFNTYLKQSNLRLQSDNEVGRKMKELGFEEKKVLSDVNDKYYRAWVNVRWKDNYIKVNSEESLQS